MDEAAQSVRASESQEPQYEEYDADDQQHIPLSAPECEFQRLLLLPDFALHEHQDDQHDQHDTENSKYAHLILLLLRGV
jgi:hypothetical protein